MMRVFFAVCTVLVVLVLSISMAQGWPEGRGANISYTGSWNGRHIEANIYSRGIRPGITDRFSPTAEMYHIAIDGRSFSRRSTNFFAEPSTTELLAPIRFPANQNQVAIEWTNLHLHRRNRDVITGFSRSTNGKLSGFYLHADDIPDERFPTGGYPIGSLSEHCVWGGRWEGYVNGEQAILTARPPSNLYPSAADPDRGTIGFSIEIPGRGVHQGEGFYSHRNGNSHHLQNASLRTSSGQTLDIQDLIIFAHNQNYMAGRFTWRDTTLGMGFHKVEDAGCATSTSQPGPAPRTGTGRTCSSETPGRPCTAVPDLCSISGQEVNGRTVCSNGRIICDVSAAFGETLCSHPGGECGRGFGETCDFSNQCFPGMSCQRGRCLPIGEACSLPGGICFTPADLEDEDMREALCRENPEVPTVPPSYTYCTSADEGNACTTGSDRCPGVELEGEIRCDVTRRTCVATAEATRLCEDMAEAR